MAKSEAIPAGEFYTEAQIKAVERHIEKSFGPCKTVFHELVSPDIHVDIYIIAPSAERNFYTLITVGMGAHKMNVPPELKEYNLERAEVMLCLPPSWQIEAKEEEYYWPLRWLKILARLPIEHNTWLGYGHTVPNGEGFAPNTKLCCAALATPYTFKEEDAACDLPGGGKVNFYQMLPLYEEEMNYKIEKGSIEAFFEKVDDDFSAVIDINRKNYCK